MKKENKKVVKKSEEKNESSKSYYIYGALLIILQICALISTKITGFGENIFIYNKLTIKVVLYLLGYFSLSIIGLFFIILGLLKQNKKTGFTKSVRKEMKNVKWPDRKDMLKYTIATLIFAIFFGLFFYFGDLIFALVKGWFN